MSVYYEELLNVILENADLVLLWLVLFQAVFALTVVWLARRIWATTPSKALELAKEARQTAHGVKVKMDSLDAYIRESFTKDFSGAMQSFDETTNSVLNQMRDELVQGVQRIEQIQSAVSKKHILQERVEEGGTQVNKLIQAPEEKLVESDEEPAEEVRDPVNA